MKSLLMHVRVKSENQTIFLYTNNTETIDDMKKNIAEIIGTDKDKIILSYNGTICDKGVVQDYEIENDDIINMVLKE